MLNEIGELAEFGQIPPKELNSMHLAKNSGHVTAVLQNLIEHVSIGFAASKIAIDSIPVLFEKAANFRAQLQVTLLGVAEKPHHPVRVFFENIVFLGIDKSLFCDEAVEFLGLGFSSGEEVYERNGTGCICIDFELEALHQRGAVLIEVSCVMVVVTHEGLAFLHHVFPGVLEVFGDEPLVAQCQDIAAASLLNVVKRISNAHEKFVGVFDFLKSRN